MEQAGAAVAREETAMASSSAQRAFSLSMIVSGIRCALAYVVLPFVTPLLGLAPGVGPGIGIVIGGVAVAANGISLRGFWVLRHRWRRPITVLHVAVIGFLLVLMWLDIGELAGQGLIGHSP